MAFQQDKSAPLEIDFFSAQFSGPSPSMRTWTSYQFERSILTPASAFRFTAPGVPKAQRIAIRSCDMAQIFAVKQDGSKIPIGLGIIDETDTHIVPTNLDYVLTGRDMLSQLVDNSSVDAQNTMVFLKRLTLKTIVQSLIANTRMPQAVNLQSVPNGEFNFSTNPGETKINALQRFLEVSNCLVWTNGFGQIIVGKPNFSQPAKGKLTISSTNPAGNNCVEARIQRGVNKAIRQIVTQAQNLTKADAGEFTVQNNDTDMKAVASAGGGRSIYAPPFTFGGTGAADTINNLAGVGNQAGNPKQLGAIYSQREIARENMNILNVEAVVKGHLNENGDIYQVDQVYNVQMEDDNVNENMYVYSCSYELSLDHGQLTRMRLCRLGAIVAQAYAAPLAAKNDLNTTGLV